MAKADDRSGDVITLVFISNNVGTIVSCIYCGLGRRFADLSVNQRLSGMKLYFFGELSFPITTLFCRLSVCVFFLRIIVKPVHVRVVHLVMIMCVLSTIMYDIMVVLQCTPIDYIWRRSIGDPAIQGTCHYTAMLVTCGYLYNSLVAACDLTLGILPLFIVRHLQMPLVTKIAVAAILSLAGLAAACAIVRFAYIGSLEGIDFLYDTVDFTIWAQLELAVGITASSLATLGPLLRLYRRLASGAEQEETPVVPERPVYRRRRGVLDLSMPLSILVGSVATQFRPDKLATTVSEVRCGPRDEEASSQIRLTAEDGRGVSAGTNETGTGIYRKYELSQISDVESNGARGKE